VAEKENRPEDRCNQSCANATRIHREVIVQDVQKNRRQYRGRESHKTPVKSNTPPMSWTRNATPMKCETETAVMNCTATGLTAVAEG
jgi:hypothetical protein